MTALIIVIGFSLLLATGFLIAFLWSTKSGQYDDDYTPSVRILFEDTPKIDEPENEKEVQKIKDKN